MSDQELRQRFLAYIAEKGHKRTKDGIRLVDWDDRVENVKKDVETHMTEIEDELLWCEFLLDRIKEMSSK